MSSKRDEVAIIGGGRWARQIASILADSPLVNGKISLCSPSHPIGWQQWLSELGEDKANRFAILETVEAVLQARQIGHVLVSRSARDNGPTAIEALRHGKAVLVEKPFASSLHNARLVVEASNDKVCLTGLVFLFAPNLHRFAEAISSNGPLQKIDIVWADRTSEQRYGESKSYDPSVNVVFDVMPHVWSLLQILVPNSAITLTRTKSEAGGRDCTLYLALEGACSTVRFVRDATERTRRIVVCGEAWRATMDFTREPGSAEIDGVMIDVGHHFTSPLRAEIDSFLSTSAQDSASALNSVQKSISALEIADAALSAIRDAQVADIVQGHMPGASDEARAAAQYAIKEIVASTVGHRWTNGCTPLVDEVWDWLSGKAEPSRANRLRTSSWLNEAKARLEAITH